MSKRITKAQLELELQAERLARHIAEERVAEFEAKLGEERLARRIAEERVAELEASAEPTPPAPPGVDDSIIADVRAKYRMDGTKVLNVCFVGDPVGGGDLARALGRGLTWIAPEPRRDRHGRWWTNCIATTDARAASASQYLDRTSPPIEAYEDA